METIEREPTKEVADAINTKGLDFEKFIKLTLLIVPILALVSANYYFVLLAWRLDVFPVSIFTVQDHFDKAIDLLLLVFGYMLITNVVIGYFMGVFGEPFVQRPPARRRSFLDFLPVVTLVLGVFELITSPTEEAWFGILMILLTVFGLFTTNIMKIVVTVFFVRRKYYNLALGSLIAIMFVGAHIFRHVESDVRRSKERYFEFDRVILQDKFSIGYLVVDDQRFRIVSDSGESLFEGERFSTESKSPGCEWGWSWACRKNIRFDAVD